VTDATSVGAAVADNAAAAAPTSTYQLLRERLRAIAERLRQASDAVNAERAAVFAGVQLTLTEQDRLHTEQPSLPRDVVSVGELLLFGFNAGGSLGRTRHVADAFALFSVGKASAADWTFTPVTADDPAYFLSDASFTRDLGELFTYYADTKLVSLQVRNDRLLMLFSVGSGQDDLRVLRWQLNSIDPSAAPQYIDAYGDHELTAVEPYDFTWKEAGRDLIVEGRWRHYAIAQTIYVGVEHRRIDFRIDDAVDGGRTVHTESVSEDQTLDELQLAYAELGDVVLLRLRPYREDTTRYFVYNRLTRAVARADALGRNCHQLPEGQGVVFPGGYHLQNGETKVFHLPNGSGTHTFGFHAAHASPNGEDLLYVYSDRNSGEYLLCAYNVVDRAMANPIVTDGYAIFGDGTMATIRHAAEPQRVHAISVYTSPFCDADKYSPPVASDSFHGRVGNPELVRVLGETLSLSRDAADPSFNAEVFEALVGRTTTLLDAYAWLNQPEAHELGGLLVELRKSAGDVLDEFASVVAAKRDAAAQLGGAETLVANLVADAELEMRDAATFIGRLADARQVLGSLSDLEDVREIDIDAVGALRARTQEVHDKLANRAVEFLGADDALQSMLDTFARAEAEAESAPTAAAVTELAAQVDEAGDRVVLLTDVVGGLQVDDTTTKTAVLSRLADALARRNGARANLDRRTAHLRVGESAAAFQAAMAVLAQRAQTSLTASATVAACDSAMAALTAELENIDLIYGDVPAHADAVTAKRDELLAAFAQRRDALGAERTRRVERLVSSAQRMVSTITARASELADRGAVDTFFSTDPMVTRMRTAIADLAAMGEAGPAGELEVAVGASRDQARRTVTDRAELFEAGNVKVGRWKFPVNSEPFELRLAPVLDDADAVSGFELRLSGTDLTVPIDPALLGDYVDLAAQVYPSETDQLPRALYLAFQALTAGGDVAAIAAQRIDEGYEPGVHDADAARITETLGSWWREPSLRLSGVIRGTAGAWLAGLAPQQRAAVEHELAAIQALGGQRSRHALVERISAELRALAADAGFTDFDVALACDWLIEHSATAVAQPQSIDAAAALVEWAQSVGIDLRHAGFGELVRWAADHRSTTTLAGAAEVAWSVLQPQLAQAADDVSVVQVDGLRSQHPTVADGTLRIDPSAAYTEFLRYQRHDLPRFHQFADRRRALLTEQRAALAVDRLRPKVITSFVRNRLIDETYLPMLGDNLARQTGQNGAAQGLLLLISPPGYGKTTLLEYLADLMGLAMVKINGPALGAEVTSLDPAAAPDAASAEELVKLNRAFAMGSNVICMIDDIQHTSPEFLQKFIPLCDATRRIEGVIDGRARTFSLSGKRFIMAMAGNPYTSVGEAFKIPDMLANRADVHNLGDVVSGARDAFAQSYVENACGVNEVLAPVLSRGRSDVETLIRAAQSGQPLRSDQLQHRYSASELTAVSATLTHLLRVRDALLKVNAGYIASATVDDHLRGEPPFLLQGSYRNMARIAQRILPAMTPAEVDQVIADHYRAESQTLAAAAGWNLLKLREVVGTATEADRAELRTLRERWKEANVAGDPLAVMANALGDIADALRPPQ
jgi:hypothetical protein